MPGIGHAHGPDAEYSPPNASAPYEPVFAAILAPAEPPHTESPLAVTRPHAQKSMRARRPNLRRPQCRPLPHRSCCGDCPSPAWKADNEASFPFGTSARTETGRAAGAKTPGTAVIPASFNMCPRGIGFFRVACPIGTDRLLRLLFPSIPRCCHPSALLWRGASWRCQGPPRASA